MTHGPGWEVAEGPRSPAEGSSRHTRVSTPGGPDVTATRAGGPLRSPQSPSSILDGQAGVRQNLLEFDEIIGELSCRTVLFGLGSLDFLVFQIIVF